MSILRRILRPVEVFLKLEAASGYILAGCTIIALLIANSAWNGAYQELLHTYVFGLSIHHWINDGLMTIFFFVVGMEIKKEIVAGELSSPRQAALPIAAAVGGMVGPALIYYFFNPEGAGKSGWGIPMATDIAFAVAVLSLFGRRVPLPLKVFLLALAIVDDLGAVLVIAFFYSGGIAGEYLGIASLLFGVIFLLSRVGVKQYWIYSIFGSVIWYVVLKSGVHATVAGVLLGLFTPLHYPKFHKSRDTYSPLQDLVHALHPYVSFGIMPIFALANAGVNLEGVSPAMILESPISLGIILGLFAGKPIGILLASLFCVSLGVARLPTGVRWSDILAVGFLGGIGFTMALFVSSLALPSDLELYSKAGILLGSLLSGIVGAGLLKLSFLREEEELK